MSRGVSRGRAAIVIALVGALAFGLYLGYLAYANDSFSTTVKPFDDYANVTSYNFNGSELAYNVTWENSSALPLYAQVTSPSTDAANTPVCSIGLSSVTSGQNVFMPFTINPEDATLQSVNLNIEVKDLASGHQFSIVFSLSLVNATNNPITPSDISCEEPPGIM